MKYSLASNEININEQLVKQSGCQTEPYSKHSDLDFLFWFTAMLESN